MGVSQADNSIKIWINLPISNPIPDIHNINVHTKFGENPLMCLLKLSSGSKKRMDGWTEGRWMDGQTDTDVQCETIISHHYCMTRYEKSIFIAPVKRSIST